MFHLHLWKVLSQVASAQCNARVYMFTFLLDRSRDEREDSRSRIAPDEPRS